ncbi:hypothetical protein U9T93_000633 [Salmonella enterica]|nr:hypothetical protein [Salmonella enterica]
MFANQDHKLNETNGDKTKKMEAVSRKTARTPAQVSMDEDANLLRLFFRHPILWRVSVLNVKKDR